MEVSQFIHGGLMPYHDEGWIFIGQSSFAKSAYLNSILVPSQMNMLVTVSLHNRINLLCKIAAGLLFLQANSRARVYHCILNGNGIFLLVWRLYNVNLYYMHGSIQWQASEIA
jgi:hypothetical protein